MVATIEPAELQAVQRLRRDLREAAAGMTADEARFFVDAYYMMQDDRKRAALQSRDLDNAEEPHSVLDWLARQNRTLEDQIKAALDRYSAAQPLGMWARSITGIGPVIAAGLLAHQDPAALTTVGQLWRFAGLDPSLRWVGREGATKIVAEARETGADVADSWPALGVATGRKPANLMNLAQRFADKRTAGSAATWDDARRAVAARPWNTNLKTLCWKIGESFVKFQNHANDHYGRFYVDRKARESARNARGDYAEQAARILREKKIGKGTDAYGHYSEGRLPPAHIHARAKRWAVKLFLSHYFEVGYMLSHGTAPPSFYAIHHLEGHSHYLPPPNIEVVGLAPWW